MNYLGVAKPQQPSVEYYPSNLGNLSPGAPRSFAFLIWGRDDKGIQVQVLNSLHRHGARITSQTGYVDEKSREFTLCISCDLASADITPDDFVIELRRMKPVKNAIAKPLKNKIFDGFMFPLTLMYSNRVIAVSSNLVFQIQDSLKLEEDKSSLKEVGRAYALDVVKQVKEKLGSAASPQIIRDNVSGYLRAAGWGTFAFESETAFERVSVTDPPISTRSNNATENYFLQGLASGLVGAFQNQSFVVAEELYNRDTRSLTIMLSKPRIESKEAAITRQKLPKDVEIRALEEVEKVIKSVKLDEDEQAIASTVSVEEDRKIIKAASTGESVPVEIREIQSPPSPHQLIEVVTAPKVQEQQLAREPEKPADVRTVEVRAIAAGPVIIQEPEEKEIQQSEEVQKKSFVPEKLDNIEKESKLDQPVESPKIEEEIKSEPTPVASEARESNPESSNPAPAVPTTKTLKPVLDKSEEEEDDEEEDSSFWFEQAVLE